MEGRVMGRRREGDYIEYRIIVFRNSDYHYVPG